MRWDIEARTLNIIHLWSNPKTLQLALSERKSFTSIATSKKLPLIIRFCPRAPELPDEKFFTGALLPSFLCLLNFVHSRREKSNAVKRDSLQSLLPEMTTQHFKWYLKVILTSTKWNDQNTSSTEIVLRSCTIIQSLKLRTWQMP